jgi:RNA polymerase sigma-70 factor (ECF subfamily)
MSTWPHGETSETLMMRVRKDPADSRAWSEFDRRYRPMIHSWCLRWGAQSSDADDIAQQVLLKLLRAMKKFEYDPSRSFRAWLKMVTRSVWTDLIAARDPKATGDWTVIDAIADSFDAQADLERRLEEAFDHELLELAMHRVEQRVKPTTWKAFCLTALDNRPGAEAAKELAMPVAHVFVAKYRVQKLLQEEVRLLRMARS